MVISRTGLVACRHRNTPYGGIARKDPTLGIAAKMPAGCSQ